MRHAAPTHLATATAVVALLVAAALGAQPTSLPEPDEKGLVNVPSPDIGAESLSQRAAAQWQAARLSGAPGFVLSDQIETSGITFEHHIVDDAGKDYKPVHYDHGNGIAAADVDGDGRLDLYLTTQLGSNALLLNRGDGRFEDGTVKAGVGLADRISVAASFADADNDGDPDLFVTTVRMGNVLFENLGEGRFRDITERAGVGHVGHSSGAVFFDFDRDGLLDLFVTNVGRYTISEKGAGGYFIGLEDAFHGHLFPDRFEASILYRNLGGLRFEDVSTARGLVDTSWSGDATFTDLDTDGYPELYVLNMQGDDHFYGNHKGERFADRTAQTFPKTPWGAMGIKFFDFDNDGRFDLILSDMHSDMSQVVPPSKELEKSEMQWTDEFLEGGANNIFGNAFYRARADGGFEEISDTVGTENYWPWGLSVGDVDADGFEDVFMTLSMNYPYHYQPNAMLMNRAGRSFVDMAFVLGIEPRRGGVTRKPWFELDCSGADRERDLCKDHEGRFTVTGTYGSRSSLIADLDQDGDLDIVTNEFNAAPQLLISTLSDRRPVRWLGVRLVGSRSNRDGLGAQVTVEAGGKRQVRFNDGKSGYLSQSVVPLYFGLDDATAIERVEVLWPSGQRQIVPGAKVGTTIEIREPAAGAEPAPEKPAGDQSPSNSRR